MTRNQFDNYWQDIVSQNFIWSLTLCRFARGLIYLIRFALYLKNHHTAYHFQHVHCVFGVKSFQKHSQFLKFWALVIFIFFLFFMTSFKSYIEKTQGSSIDFLYSWYLYFWYIKRLFCQYYCPTGSFFKPFFLGWPQDYLSQQLSSSLNTILFAFMPWFC